MFRERLATAALLLLLCAGLAAMAHAQDENLLAQAGFDDQYTNRGRTDLNIPRGWGLWLADTPGDTSWQDHVFAFPHQAAPEVHGGAASLNLSGGYATITAAVYQQATVERGTPLLASAWAWLHTCNLARDDEDTIVGGICDSAVESGAQTLVGIDPNGGTNPLDADVVWSEPARPHDRWEQIRVEATATGPVVTIFLYVTQNHPADLNNVYWDDASLTIVSGASTPATPPATLPAASIGPLSTAVAPAETTPEAVVPGESSQYVVQPGDTFDLIALRFGLSRAELLALNPGLDPRRLRVGETIYVGSGE